MASQIISILYVLIIIIFVAMGLAIIFHMLHYRINRRAAMIMFIIYVAGAAFLLISNISLFFSVNWYQIINSFGF